MSELLEKCEATQEALRLAREIKPRLRSALKVALSRAIYEIEVDSDLEDERFAKAMIIIAQEAIKAAIEQTTNK